ncbi:ABC transporter substrate-binding protein [Leifsonia sp. 21MFCrub1.1]|uniref:ABC transporter substrate-binding protein n=1 Tax=Leifsonia sp. 21MFCrub1.1 TaxID=1798223 RepID=UPI000892896A|nr:extracellular solute-binding protein [Leifsonia sp. 21MFCrub1.1]SEB09991.1 ABC-type glycerol-3-phosphate transport system, substrate-binding protein [Leifsonia sp. 21MFCrub1.1]
MHTKFRPLAAVAAVAVAAALITGCTSNASGDSGKVSITVAGQPSKENPDQLKAFNQKVETFNKANADIKVTGEESDWNASTFQALVAGGKLPTVFYVPFTEIQGVIARQQAIDLTDSLTKDSDVNRINPSILSVAKASNGHIYGVPTAAYSMGLLYNRALFAKAGLDPDKPPTTWDEVRSAAKKIQDATGVQGFGAMTKDNTGGWVLTAMSYANGSTIQSKDGKKAKLDNDATREALQFYRELRWDDNTFGSNFLVGYNDAMSMLAGGKVGMIVQGADAYTTVVQSLGMKADDFGLAPLPQASKGIGTLGGGSVAIVSPKATPDQVKAALKWIDFASFKKYGSESAAVTNAKAAAADKLPVGAPELPLFDQATTDRYYGWIADEINVPRKNFSAYFSSAQSLPLVPEPSTKAQEIYSVMDNVVQSVLTQQNADIDALLSDAQKKAQAVIDAG